MGQVSSGDTSLVLISAALVLLMTPGLAFYGGLVRQTKVLTIMLQSFIAMGVVSVLWVLVGFSLAHSGDIGGVIAGFAAIVRVGRWARGGIVQEVRQQRPCHPPGFHRRKPSQVLERRREGADETGIIRWLRGAIGGVRLAGCRESVVHRSPRRPVRDSITSHALSCSLLAPHELAGRAYNSQAIPSGS